MERFGDYELIRHIATGGMAELFLARHNTGGLDRVVVIKRMLPELAVRPDFVTMFLDEARLTASLQHPHVVRVYDLGHVAGSYFIAMELVDGPHLGALFAHSLRARRPLPLELCAWIVARAADGLHYAHDVADPATGRPLELVHRDISPQNILVGRGGDVKVTDFGVAKASTQQTKTRTGVVKGKVSYMSPEQCLGDVVDRRTDVFALGIVLYELLTRRRLFRDKSDLLVMQRITGEDVAPPSTLNASVNAELDAIVLRALARSVDVRYATAGEFAEAIDGWLIDNRRPADALSLQTWFAAHCPELAPSHATGLPPSTPSREALALAGVSPTLTPSSSRRAEPERGVLHTEPTPVSLPRSAQPTRERGSRPTERLLLVEPPNTQADVDDGPPTPSGILETPRRPSAKLAVAAPRQRTGWMLAGAVVLAGVGGLAAVLLPESDAASTTATTTVEVVSVPPGATRQPVADEGRGVLSVNTDPSTLVQLDEETVGDTPFVDRPVKAGQHTLVVKNADLGLEDRFVIVITRGATLAVTLQYDKVNGAWKQTKKTVR